MICQEFIELSKLLEDKGIEIGGGKRVVLSFPMFLDNGPLIVSDKELEEQFNRAVISDKAKKLVKHYVAPTISDILTVAFGERMWGVYLETGRRITITYWDNEKNKPLHECPKLCAWLVGEVKI